MDRDVKNVHEELNSLAQLGVIFFEEPGQRKRPVVWFDDPRRRERGSLVSLRPSEYGQ